MSFFIPTAAAGNGLCLASFGRTGELMGFFYPRIDFAQNVREGMHAVRLIGAAERSKFLWCFDEAWRVAQSFEQASNVLVTRLAHRELELAIQITDVLPPEEHVLLRRIQISRGPDAPAVQFMHYFRLALGDVTTRNGVFTSPEQNLVVQYLRDIAVAVTASEPFAAQCGATQGSTESSTKAAMRTGSLGTSPHAIGRVDFAIGFEPVSTPTWETTLVIAGGQTADAAAAAAKAWTHRPFEEAVAQAGARCEGFLATAPPCPIYELAEAYERAVLSLHDLYDESQGTFIAAPEFDPGFEFSGGYGYCWPRDAAVCALAMQRIGRTDRAWRFFEWAARTQLPNGHWFQRYWTDGSPAPSWCVRQDEIQLDQTCALLHAAGLFARRLAAANGSSATFVKAFGPSAERAAQAIIGHVAADGLHRPATDLWECSRGSFPYTQAAVIAAFREADEIFGIAPNLTGPAARSILRSKLLATFWVPERHRWLRRISPDGRPDPTLDSSAMGVIDPWEVLDLTEPTDRLLAVQTLDGIGRDLRCPVKGGGAILRFQNESYMGGGPGLVNTLWLALCGLRLAATAEETAEARAQRAMAMAEIRVTLANLSPTGQLPELVPRGKFEYWAAPHAWACSLLIEAVVALRSMEPPANSFDEQRAQVRRRRAPSH